MSVHLTHIRMVRYSELGDLQMAGKVTNRRITITLEPDVADYIDKKLAGDPSLSRTNLINDLLRKGIETTEMKNVPRFRINSFKTNLCESVTAKDLERMLDEI